MSTTLSRATAVVTGGAALTPTLSPEAFAARAAESNLPFILGMIIPFFVLAFVAVVLRTYVRTRIVKVMGIDDWVMLAALACSIVSMAVFAWQSEHSLGRHQNTVSAEHMKIHRKGNLIYSCIGAVLGLHLVKISICFLLMRFVQAKAYKIALWSIIAFLCCFTLSSWGTLIFFCLPVKAFWDVSLRRLPTTYCYPQVHFTNISLMNTSFNMATDVLLATLPVHIIWTLQINQRQKLSLIAVLSLGYAAVGLGVVKAIKQVELPTDRDATWTQGVQMWGFVQFNVAIIAACMPALRPLFAFLSDAVSSRNRTRGVTNPNTRSGYFRQYDSSGTKKTKNGTMQSYGGGDMDREVPLHDLEANGGVGGKAFVSANVSQRSDNDKSWIDAGDSGSEKDILPGKPMGGIGVTTTFHIKSDSVRD